MEAKASKVRYYDYKGERYKIPLEITTQYGDTPIYPDYCIEDLNNRHLIKTVIVSLFWSTIKYSTLNCVVIYTDHFTHKSKAGRIIDILLAFFVVSVDGFFRSHRF